MIKAHSQLKQLSGGKEIDHWVKIVSCQFLNSFYQKKLIKISILAPEQRQFVKVIKKMQGR